MSSVAPNTLEAGEVFRLENIGKQYRRGGARIDALRDFSLALRGGEVLGLLGPNGAGKTTVIKLLASLLQADSGQLYWRGAPLRGKRHLGEVGLILEGRGALNERLSTWENARYFCALRERPFDPGHFDELAALLDISDRHAPVRQLSTGNKLKSALLVSVIHRPSVLCFDEPTIGLDLFGVASLERLIRYMAARGAAVLISSHDLHFVEQLADRVACVCRGRKVFDGSRQDFLAVEHAYQLQLDSDPAGLPALPAPFAWRTDGAGAGRLDLRDHAELCTVLAAIIGSLPAARGLQVASVTLQAKYQALVQQAGVAA